MKIYRKNSNSLLFKFFISFTFLVLMTYLKPIIINADTPNWMYLLENNRVTAFAEDGDFMWIAIYGENIYKMDKKTLTIVDSTGGVGYNIVSQMTLDKKGNLWIAAQGLYKYAEMNFTEIDLKSIGSGIYCSKVDIDENDNIWIGTSKGIGYYDGSEWIIFNSENSALPKDAKFGTNISALHILNNNNIWAAVENQGIANFNGIEWIIYKSSIQYINFDLIQTIKSDIFGNVWFAVNLISLIKYDGQNWTEMDKKNSPFPHFNIGKFNFDAANNMYISDFQDNKAGLIKYDGINWTSYNMDNSELHSNTISDFIIDKNGNKWLALSGNNYGLNIFNENGINLATGIETENKKTALMISPNPVKDFIILDNGEYSGSSFIIYDINGVELIKSIISGNRINVSNLNAGTYFLEIKDVKQNQKLKFIKN